ncbi:MAG: F0F1 ATP synthase subunit A [Flavobacteriales bacterium]|nr:F0F1 ATP synthase subunit A [Flavobacteriales bacterium]
MIGALLLGPVSAQHEGHDLVPGGQEHVHEDSASAVSASAAPAHHDEAKGGFDAGQLIMGHIGDEHGWHLWGHTSLPLPIILYSSERGLSVFSSSRFDHGHKTYGGYALHDGHIVAVNDPDGTDAHHASINEDLTRATWDISITKNVMSLLVSAALLLIIFISVAKAYTRRTGQAPTGLQNLVEPIVLFVRDDVAKSAIGHKYERFLPYLLTAFFFIFLNNLLGLVPIFPGGANLTGNIAVTLVLALLTFIIVTVNGNKHYWHHILAMPGVPGWVLAILTPVEILGMFLKPFVLMIRLFANITAGHIIALSFFSLIFVFGETSAGAGYGVAVGSWAFTVFMMCLELLVAFIQAYVFTFLSAMYIGAAVEEPHHH